MSKNISKILTKTLAEYDKNISGNLLVKENDKNKNSFIVNGELSTKLSVKEVSSIISDTFKEINKNYSVMNFVSINKNSLTIVESKLEDRESSSTGDSERNLDEVKVLFTGELPFNLIQRTDKFKKINFETRDHFRLAYEVFNYIEPLVLDRNFKIIDGMLRYEVFSAVHGDKSLQEKIPVIILDVDSARADVLRLMLNRLPEFQRWVYDDIDKFVDDNSFLQALLEPIGFFGTTMFTPSFYGNTIIEYHLDEFNTQMGEYTQDIGLEAWAKDRKAERDAREARKIEKRNAPKAGTPSTSLFDLMRKETKKDDVLTTTDPEVIVQEHVDEIKVVADGITTVYDEKRKAEKEARGQAWQTNRRTSKVKSAELRAEAEEELKKTQKLIKKMTKKHTKGIAENLLDEELNEINEEIELLKVKEIELLNKFKDAEKLELDDGDFNE